MINTGTKIIISSIQHFLTSSQQEREETVKQNAPKVNGRAESVFKRVANSDMVTVSERGQSDVKHLMFIHLYV